MRTRMAGDAMPAGFLPKANLIGQGCAKEPENYPPLIKPTMSHGDPTTYIAMK